MEQMTLETFETMLRGHDWYFNYSDDSRWYNRGLQQRREIDAAIENLRAQGFEQEVRDLFNDLSPDGFLMREPKSGNSANLS